MFLEVKEARKFLGRDLDDWGRFRCEKCGQDCQGRGGSFGEVGSMVRNERTQAGNEGRVDGVESAGACEEGEGGNEVRNGEGIEVEIENRVVSCGGGRDDLDRNGEGDSRIELTQAGIEGRADRVESTGACEEGRGGSQVRNGEEIQVEIENRVESYEGGKGNLDRNEEGVVES